MLVLASASPRRQELLRNAGITFTVRPANVDETPVPGETPRECAERLARDKALAVWRDHPKELVLGADTVVVAGSEMLAKPLDAKDAARMLRLLSGRKHEVITGVCLVKPALRTQCSAAHATSGGDRNFELRVAAETTVVTMYEISEQEILEYVATGEPMDKAGAYAIQGMASRWIPMIEGDYTNVVGLPVALVYRMLRETELTEDNS
jgi:septum formation protein